MLATILDHLGKTVESTLKLQQEVLRSWTVSLAPFGFRLPGLAPTGTPTRGATPIAAWLGQPEVARRMWAEIATEMLHRHRETLDEQYRAGIRTIGDALRVAEARDFEQLRRLSEELRRRNSETFRTAVASQIRDVQAVMEKWYGAALEGATGSPGSSPIER
jgi:hypothetical protein